MNRKLALSVLHEARAVGVAEYCVCPGGRNAPLVAHFSEDPSYRCYYWHDERAAAFFAIGRSRITGKPVGVVTTSGTAAGEMLPAAMEAYYSGVPLLLITADRPRRFRGTAAPQSAEQVGIYGMYAPFAKDIALEEHITLREWSLQSPAHLNLCFEEPLL